MAKQKYAMNVGKKIVFKADSVRHGFWGAYTNILVITNQCVILEEYGLFSNFKDIKRYPLSEINQAIIGKATNGEKQLELYMLNGDKEDFALQSGDDNVLKTLSMAINDQLSGDSEYYDYSYYESIVDGSEAAIKSIEQKNITAIPSSESDAQLGLNFVGDVAKNILKSGDLSFKGLSKSVKKASSKQAKSGILNGFVDELLDDFGIYDIQDCFTEIGNDFREEFGLKPKMTHEERRDLIEQEKERKEQELKRQKNEAYNKQVQKARQVVESKKTTSNKQADVLTKESKKMSINEQLDTLKKLKELMDMGILTQEEFDQKKKEILSS